MPTPTTTLTPAPDPATFFASLAAADGRSRHAASDRVGRLRGAAGWAAALALGARLRARRERATAGVPRLHASVVLGRVRDTPAIVALRGLVRGEDGSRLLVVLLGAPDAGKSVALAWIVRQLRGRWVDGEQLLDAWTADRRGLLEAPLLAVDDVGRPGSADQRAAAADVLDATVKLRAAEGRATVVSANLSPEGLQAWWSSGRRGEGDAPGRWDRFSERLRQHGLVLAAGIPGAAQPRAGLVVLEHLGLRRREHSR